MKCKVESCEKLARSRGWCNTHYERWRKGADVEYPGDLRAKKSGTCTIEGCDQKAAGRGWCKKHWRRWKDHGDPEYLERLTYGSKRRVGEHGYILIYEPNHPCAYKYGYVLEHRKVMYDAGHNISGMDVHHKNGNIQDNRIENLEIVDPANHQKLHHGIGCNQFRHDPSCPKAQ